MKIIRWSREENKQKLDLIVSFDRQSFLEWAKEIMEKQKNQSSLTVTFHINLMKNKELKNV